MTRPALAATRALDIVSFLAEHPREAFTMAQLRRALGLSQGSAHAILTTMTDQGFLTRHPQHKTFRLGPVLVVVGDAATRANPLLPIAREELAKLSATLDLPVLASMRTADELRVVVRVGPLVASEPARAGQRYPLVPPLGTVLVAWAPRPVQEQWIASRPPEVSADELEELLDEVRARGYDIARGTAARRELGVAAERLAGAPLDDERRSGVRVRAGLVPSSSDDDVAAITTPVLNASHEAVLETTVYGFRRRPGAAVLREAAHATRDACVVISRRAEELG